MTKFYGHLIELETVIVELNKLELDDNERHHLATLIDSTIHNMVLDTIFSHLSEEDKKLFLEKLSSNDHDEIWNFLNSKVDNIEEKIKLTTKELKDKLHEDLKEAHSIHRKHKKEKRND
ncbi:MAG: hypothetical protein US86_C0001G0307 [Candidatus Daviesbacteria bacterium GW2011_GWA2_38_24]|uniref:Uncharacterized protein n=1 Tax=Candidatus Daviesbacteria bacterium GW2011_GWA2_38_24 TaxID=1618422 RepID=A0A0G0JW88_9BACT|nr:MAG: hypothetical protein US86_C0001G0307 [Candidatus Daviesbacteria bacterium GW2011_GWA2_38_24]KKQ79928.1 MAG: hypothetical protein UT01_C0024G0009 [Candidatus Daviesbacteria bacterium GW2011_GWA1_38_7]OGE23452.1 MAG: hypothetical protein A2688_01540 [Candidatus Daviesbacteria bacterium RIFCSPHIGHO2_01_FULL_38_8]